MFLLLCIAGELCLDARHCELISLGAGYFCLPVSILGLCSGAWLSCLKTLWSFHFLLWKIFRQDQSNIWYRDNYSHYWGRTLLSTLPNTLWIIKFLNQAGRNGYYFWPLCVCEWFLLIFQMVLSPALGGLSTTHTNPYPADVALWGSLCTQLSSVCPVTLSLPASQLCPLNWALGSFPGPLPGKWPQSALKVVIGSRVRLTLFVSHLWRVTVLHHLMFCILKNILSLNLSDTL